MRITSVSKNAVEFFKKNARRITCTAALGTLLVAPVAEGLAEENENTNALPTTKIEQMTSGGQVMTDQEVISELSNKTESAMEVSISIDGANHTLNINSNEDINAVVSQFQDMVTSEFSKEEKQEIANSISDDIVFVIKTNWTSEHMLSDDLEREVIKFKPRNIESLEYYANHPEELQNIAEFVSDNTTNDNELNENFEIIDRHTESVPSSQLSEEDRKAVDLEIKGTDISIRIVAPSVVRYQKYREELEAKWEAGLAQQKEQEKQEQERNSRRADIAIIVILAGCAVLYFAMQERIR